jgi:TonB-linked SusC/RagA family outer membrane protein
MRRLTTTGALILAMLVAHPALSTAQQVRTITGHVILSGVLQNPAGVQVLVRGTQLGVLTDQQGNFSITVPGSATTLVFTYIGFKTVEVPIETHVEVTMEEEPISLSGIVVTALGVEREKRTLGYSVQDVRGDLIAAVPKDNLVNALQGQVAGVQVTNAGVTGGSSRIVIRGAGSITGENQPLFIIDGIPVDNSSRYVGGSGVDWGNSIQDIDPNNIESISVLKGPNAAALYGTRAANGAVVITTKSAMVGATGLGITATSSITFQQPLRLPRYQNGYGQGYNGEFQFVDGAGAGLWDYVDESWGPKLDGRPIDQFTGKQQPWLPHPNNVRDYFRTGSDWNTNVAVERASENSNIRLSVSNTKTEGMSPANTIDRKSVALKGGASVTSRLKASATMNYLVQDSKNRMGTGYYDDNIMQNFTWFGRQVDLNALKHWKCDGTEPTACIEGQEYNWNYNYHDNPYWVQYANGNADERDRVIGDVQVDYQVNDWITVTGKVAKDWYRWHRKDNVEQGTVGSWAGVFGGFMESTDYRSETNMDLMATATRQLTSDFLLDVAAGANTRKNEYVTGQVRTNALTVPGIFTIDNTAEPMSSTDFSSEKQVRSVYGSASLNYNGWLNLDVTGRNDWSSTLPQGNRSFFYPSISTSFLFTDALGVDSPLLSSGKIRASWTRVGNDTDPYQLVATLSAQTPYGGAPMFTVPNQLYNAFLKPEQVTSWEIGTDLGFFNERMGFVLTYYNSTTRDLIMPVDISGSSGYTSQYLNAGEVRNKGIELLLHTQPLRLENGFRWDVTVNWSKNDNEVVKLYGDLNTLVLGSSWSLNLEARPGEPYGIMFGNGYLRCGDEQISDGDCSAAQRGLYMLDEDGYPMVDPVRRILGKYPPDWNGGIQNRFRYGSFDLSTLFDGQWGGNVFSVTEYFGVQAGVLQRTMRGREDDICSPGIVERGVLPDGSTNGEGGNAVTLCPEDYFHSWWGNNETAVVDASYLKFREARLTYRLPETLMDRLGFSSGDVSIIGRNLYLWAKTPNIDPETARDASNVQGLESGQFPTARSFGFSVTIRP